MTRLAAFLCAALACGGAVAQELVLAPADRTGLAVTIYADGMALVKDRRAADLPVGAAALAFEGVTNGLLAASALLRPLGGGDVRIAAQTFEFDLLTPERLLERSVGKEVTLIRTDPKTGAETVGRARVLAVREGLVLEIDGRIETELPGRLAFDALPPGLRRQPTLVAHVEALAAGRREFELSYLTDGLAWRADYVAELNQAADSLRLTGWASLTNTSGAAFPEARLSLVAGSVNRVERPQPALRAMAMEAKSAPMANAELAAQPLLAFHIYDLPKPVSLAEGQTRQVALVAGRAVPVEREYSVAAEPWFFRARRPDLPEARATLAVRFTNAETAGLGLPLPNGIVRAYKPDARGELQFVGEDRIPDTPAGEKVRLVLGEDFDVAVERTQTGFEQVARDVTESAWRIRIRNAKAEAVTVLVREPLHGDWQIVESSAPHEKEDAATALWRLPVPAKGEAVLTYRVRVRG